MSIPIELQYIIISFIPQSRGLVTVCKEWNNELKNIRKNAVNIIGIWYKKRIISLYTEYITIKSSIRYYVLHFNEEHFIEYPEFIIVNFDLNEELLDVLPPIMVRKRSEVRDWIINIYNILY